MQFGAEYRDAESGFYYLRARYYDPGTGQFLTRDPNAVLTRQPYGYVRDNPLNYRDPSGLDGKIGEEGGGVSGEGGDPEGQISEPGKTRVPVSAWEIIRQFRPLTEEEEQQYEEYLRSEEIVNKGPNDRPCEKIEVERIQKCE